MQQELTILKDQITAVIRVSAHSAKHITDFEKLIITMPFNIVAAQLETFNLSERIASTVPCNLLVHARTTLHTAEIHYNNNIVPRQPLINAQNALQVLNECTTKINIIFMNCDTRLDFSATKQINFVKYKNNRTFNYRHSLRDQGLLFLAAQNSIITACAYININVILISIHDIHTVRKYHSGILKQIQDIITHIRVRIIQEEINLVVCTYARFVLEWQIQLQSNRNTAADTFHRRATILITLILNQMLAIPSSQTVTRAQIRRAKTDTLHMIRRNCDYALHRESTLVLIKTWWTVNTLPQTECDVTFTSVRKETEHFLAVCIAFKDSTYTSHST